MTCEVSPLTLWADRKVLLWQTDTEEEEEEEEEVKAKGKIKA
jgi:hypothetical protein